jgi:signal peptidase I
VIGAETRARRGDRQAALLVVPLTLVLVALLLLRFVFFEYATVDGESMKPALLPEDHLMLTRGYAEPRRGDIIVFRSRESGRPIEVVKRVVGIPGDTVRTQGDAAWVNGKPEQRDFSVLTGDSRREVGPLTVPAGSLFVLVDNRAISLDSRFIGVVPMDAVIGRAVSVYAPVTRLQMLAHPPGRVLD